MPARLHLVPKDVKNEDGKLIKGAYPLLAYCREHELSYSTLVSRTRLSKTYIGIFRSDRTFWVEPDVLNKSLKDKPLNKMKKAHNPNIPHIRKISVHEDLYLKAEAICTLKDQDIGEITEAFLKKFIKENSK